MLKGWFGGGARPRENALERAIGLVRAVFVPPGAAPAPTCVVEMSAEQVFQAVAQIISLALEPEKREQLTEITAALFAAAATEAAEARGDAATPGPAPNPSMPHKDHVGNVAAHMRDIIYDPTRALYIYVPDAAAVGERINEAARAHDASRVARVLDGLVERAVEHARAHGTTVPFHVVDLLPGEWRSVRAQSAQEASVDTDVELHGAARIIAEFCQRLAWSLETGASASAPGRRALYVRLPDTRGRARPPPAANGTP